MLHYYFYKQEYFAGQKHLVYGKSITDPCLGWEKTEKLIFDIYELRKAEKEGRKIV